MPSQALGAQNDHENDELPMPRDSLGCHEEE